MNAFTNNAIDSTIVVDLILDALANNQHALYDRRSSRSAYWILREGKKSKHRKGVLPSLALDSNVGFGYPLIKGTDKQELRLWLQYVLLNADIHYGLVGKNDKEGFWVDCQNAVAAPRWFDEHQCEIPHTRLLIIVEYHDKIAVKSAHGYERLPSYLKKHKAKWSRKLGKAPSQSGKAELKQRTQKLLNHLFSADRRWEVAENEYDMRSQDSSFILSLGEDLDMHGFFTGPSIRDASWFESPDLDAEPSKKLSPAQWEKRTEYRSDIHTITEHFEPPLINALMKGKTRPKNCRGVISLLVAIHTCRELLDQMAWRLVHRAISSGGETLYRDFQTFERVANAFAFRDAVHLPSSRELKPLLPRLDRQKLVKDWPDFTLERAIENLRVSWSHCPPAGVSLQWFR